MLRLTCTASAAAIALLIAGCGNQNRATRTPTYSENTQLVPNESPDAGAASVTDALAKLRTALTQGDAAELCRLFAYVPQTNCVADWTPLYRPIGPVSTRIISTQQAGQNTVVFEVEHRRGLKLVALGGRLAVGQQHGRWFIGDIDQ
jgi:hypothetical protein